MAPYAAALLGALALAALLLNIAIKNAALKRRWYPRALAVVLVLFDGFAVYYTTASTFRRGGSLEDAAGGLLLIPVLAYIFYVNVKTTRFCDHCGGAFSTYRRTTPLKVCPRCQTPLSGPN